VKRSIFRGFSVGLAVIATSLCAAAPAGADSLGKSHGYKYVSKSTEAPGGGSAVVAAKCPRGTAPISGGAEIAGNDLTAAYMSSSYPAKRNWKAGAWYLGVDDATLTAYAVCTKNTDDLVVEKEQSSVSDEFTDAVVCAKGSATGGGFRGAGDPDDWWLSSSAPVDDIEDADELPDDGWVIDFEKVPSGDLSATGYAICLKKKAVEYVTGNSDTSAPLIERSSTCLTGTTLVGGGFDISGLPSVTHLVEIRPVDGGDLDEVPDDTWAGTAVNPTMAPRGMRYVAVCV
jgi:hypothetical protein